MRISIHAPARGATGYAEKRRKFNLHFNPRAREGRDTLWTPHIWGVFNFNPRAREGRDTVHLHNKGHDMDFNPRAREGRDTYGYLAGCISGISIHAPARGATNPTTQAGTYQGYFNPRAREGRDVINRGTERAICDFNPRAREGRDRAIAELEEG